MVNPDEKQKSTQTRVIMCCPKCSKQLVFSTENGEAEVTCPICHCDSAYIDGQLYLIADKKPAQPTKVKKNSITLKQRITMLFSRIYYHIKKRKKVLLFCILSAIVVCIAIYLACTIHTHKWNKATCTKPRTCTICGKTEGKATGHHWSFATCTEPKTCIECYITEGEPLGHDWEEATCTQPKTCKRCGKPDGTALGHLWTAATLLTPKTCKRCGEMEAMSLPESGKVIIGAGAQTSSELTISAAGYSVYVKLKDQTGKDVFSFFVRAFDTKTVAVPAGKYYVYFASGSKWYGIKYYFGEETLYSKDNDLSDFSNYTYTYNLHLVTDGNFSTTPVSQNEFD